MTTYSGAPEPRTVVLVDDTPDVRALVRRALERDGGLRVVAEAGDGSAGLEAVLEHQPDAVLLDIAMPVMDGLEALPLIREASPQTTVIMLSGFGADQMVEKALDSGAAGYIQKGRPMRELVSQVHSLMNDDEGGAGFRGGPAGSPPGMLNRVFAAWRTKPRPDVALL
jgi:DNA-binding NarL/FixJ family response regulator